MFVRSSTHDKLHIQCLDAKTRAAIAEQKYLSLMQEWNVLVRQINDSGGKQFLDGSAGSNEFSKSEIKTLLSLCHPDKHGGKKSATDITVKLLALRAKLTPSPYGRV